MSAAGASFLVLVLLTTVVGAILVTRRLVSPPVARGNATASGRRNPNALPAVGFIGHAGPVSGRVISIQKTPFRIGRDAARNDLQVNAQLVSREHAVVVFHQGRFILHDNESTNGVFVNGQRVGEHELRAGDKVLIGPAVLEFQRAGETPASHGVTVLPRDRVTPAPAALPIHSLSQYSLALHREGGTSVVYRATRPGNPTLAVKVLTHTDPYIRQKFADEARLIRSLSHRYIARAMEAGEMGGVFYIVMEYCEGGSLRDRLGQGRPLPAPEIARIVGQVCEAIHYAHLQGIVHRDIKPENILFDARGGVKVVDFGIAKFSGSLTQTAHGIVVGTPFYLSYEQARGLEVDPRSDIYSLGIVLYEMLTGRVPFHGKDVDVTHQHLTAIPRPPREVYAACDPHQAQVALRALAKNRIQRFQTALEMATALGSAPKNGSAPNTMTPPGQPQASNASTPISQRAPRLVIDSGAFQGRAIPLNGGELVLGRDSINPTDVSMSRHHARIVRRGDVWWLEDLQSGNGTFHNGRPVLVPVPLQPGRGDEIRLAQTSMRLM